MVKSIIAFFTNLKEWFKDRINFRTIIPGSLSKHFLNHNAGKGLPNYINSQQEAHKQQGRYYHQVSDVVFNDPATRRVMKVN